MAFIKSVLHSVVISLWLFIILGGETTTTYAQNAYRPYRPISNIFGSLFRPTGGGVVVAPPPQQRRASNSNNNNQNSNNEPPGGGPQAGAAPNLPLEEADAAQKTSAASTGAGNGLRQNLPPPPPPPQRANAQRQEQPHPPPHPGRRPPPLRPRPVPLRGTPPRILLRPQGPHGPLIGPIPKRPLPPQDNGIPSLGQVLTLVSSTAAAASDLDESTPASTTASAQNKPHSTIGQQDELNAPSTDSNLYIIDELNRAVPGVEIHNSLEDSFLPPPTAASLVGSPPGLDQNSEGNFESGTLSPAFKVQPRGHSAPVIISQVPVKSFQSSSQVLTEPMPDKHHHHDHNHHQPRDLFTADSQTTELLTPYPQPRFYDPVSSRTFRSQEKRSRGQQNSKRFHFDSEEHQQHGHHAHAQHQNHHQHSHRDDRLLHHHDPHSHNHQNEIIERIDEVIELVDCGGRDLGFCDMSSKYPGHMMGNLMSDCQELVYSGFVPVPDDLEELGDSNPVAKYSNSSKSAVRAQTGSWSWKPYTYESKQVCDSELRFIRPGYARDSTGKWQVVVQTEDLPQRVAIDLCHSPGKPCHSMSDCGRKSRCIQRYNFQHLLAVDPDNLHSCPTIRAFKFPSSCVCHIEFPNHHEDFYK